MEPRTVSKAGEVPYRRTTPWGRPIGRFWNPENRVPCSTPPFGELVAVDVNRAVVRWRVPLGVFDDLKAHGFDKTGTPNIGGTIATASGLVFIGGTIDGRFRAFDADTGGLLWETTLDASAHATPMTFLGKDGRQYVVDRRRRRRPARVPARLEDRRLRARAPRTLNREPDPEPEPRTSNPVHLTSREARYCAITRSDTRAREADGTLATISSGARCGGRGAGRRATRVRRRRTGQSAPARGSILHLARGSSSRYRLRRSHAEADAWLHRGRDCHPALEYLPTRSHDGHRGRRDRPAHRHVRVLGPGTPRGPGRTHRRVATRVV